MPVLKNPASRVKSAAFSQYPRFADDRQLMGYSMRTERYRFTQWVVRDRPSEVVAVELYDHQADPQENENVAADPSHQELVRELSEQAAKGWRGAKTP